LPALESSDTVQPYRDVLQGQRKARRFVMPYYLVQAAYTPEAWAGLVKKPQDRARALRPIAKQLKGRLVSLYLAFGDYDIVGVVEFPDNDSAAAFSMAAAAGGAVKGIKTTPLMTVQEGVKAMRKAKRAGYKPPS
jgi:uncharacterized protein with GYD domain